MLGKDLKSRMPRFPMTQSLSPEARASRLVWSSMDVYIRLGFIHQNSFNQRRWQHSLRMSLSVKHLGQIPHLAT